jgi:M6 family metalloprotease-like protein
MKKLFGAALVLSALTACGSSDHGDSDGDGAKGGGAGAGAGGAAMSGGAGGKAAQGGSAGATTGGSAGMGAMGGMDMTGDWPTYEEAEKGATSTKVLVLLLDFADSDQNDLVPNAEEAWGKMIFGREHSNGNNYWYENSGGQFQLLPAAETQLTPNNGVVHIKVAETKPTTGVLQAQDQPWLTEALDKAAEFVDFDSFDEDKDGVLQNTELSVLFIINWEFDQIAGAPAEANIPLSHPIAGTGVTLDKFARDMYLHTSIGISMHELGHHILDLDHTPSPTDHDLMGMGAYYPDPVVSTLHDPNWFNATRPTQLKAMHKVRAGWVTPTEVTGSMTGVKLYGPELGKQYNVLKLPIAGGFLIIDNRHGWDYDLSIPYCNGGEGAIFVDEVAQYLNPLWLTDAAPPTDAEYEDPWPTMCDIYAVAGHNDTFTHGGWKITNVSAPGPIMTLDIEKLDVTPAIDHYTLEVWLDKDGSRTRYQKRLDGDASTFDYSRFSGGDTVDGYVSIAVNAIYNTGEVLGMALDTTYSSDSPYVTVANAGKFTNGGCPTPNSLTTFTFHTEETPVTQAKITFTTGTLNHTVTFTNLPQP